MYLFGINGLKNQWGGRLNKKFKNRLQALTGQAKQPNGFTRPPTHLGLFRLGLVVDQPPVEQRVVDECLQDGHQRVLVPPQDLHGGLARRPWGRGGGLVSLDFLKKYLILNFLTSEFCSRGITERPTFFLAWPVKKTLLGLGIIFRPIWACFALFFGLFSACFPLISKTTPTFAVLQCSNSHFHWKWFF